MLFYDHFFGTCKNIHLDYDYLHTVNGHDELPIRFARTNDQSRRSAWALPSAGDCRSS